MSRTAYIHVTCRIYTYIYLSRAAYIHIYTCHVPHIYIYTCHVPHTYDMRHVFSLFPFSPYVLAPFLPCIYRQIHRYIDTCMHA